MHKGIVAAVNPGDHSVDVVLADGRRLTGVQVATPNGSTRTGTFDMPAAPDRADRWDITKLSGQDQIALVEWVDGIPVVVGFLFPQISQMSFDDVKRHFYRHQSDVYHTIDGSGDMELHHPSGTYVRIAQSPEHEDLSGKNTDASLGIDRNTGSQVHVHIRMAGNVASVDIAPDGEITINTVRSMTVNAQKQVVVNTQEETIVNAQRDVVVNTQQNAVVNTQQNAQVNTQEDADVRCEGNASVRSEGWGQFVGDGPVLIKSNSSLKLKGPGGQITL